MKNLFYLVSLAAVSLGLNSCCKMFGLVNQGAGYRTETRQVKTCYYDTVTEEVAGDAKSGMGGMVVEKEFPATKRLPKKCGFLADPVSCVIARARIAAEPPRNRPS